MLLYNAVDMLNYLLQINRIFEKNIFLNMNIHPRPKGLTLYPLGSFRELVAISAPLILVLLSTALIGFCDRLFLARYSIQTLEACTTALALSSLFQVFIVRMILTSKVYIGGYQGSAQLDQMGRCTWQLIWLSLFLFLFAIPLSFVLEHFFFRDIVVGQLAIPYFRLLIPLNLFLPLGAALSAFYAGQGQTKTVFYVSLIANGVNLMLAPLLIFGIKGVCPSFGLPGAACATLVGQGIFCVILFSLFLQKKNQITFGTNQWQFKGSHLLQFLKLGIPRGMARAIPFFMWVVAVRLVAQTEGPYLLVVSFLSTIQLLFVFVIEGMGQGLVVIGSYIAGLKRIEFFKELIASTLLFLALGGALLAIPFVIYPEWIIGWVMPDLQDPELEKMLRHTCYWTYLVFWGLGINSIGHNLLTALRSTVFQMVFQICFSWLLVYGAIFTAVEVWQSPGGIQLAMLIGHLIMATAHFVRLRMVTRQASVSAIQI